MYQLQIEFGTEWRNVATFRSLTAAKEAVQGSEEPDFSTFRVLRDGVEVWRREVVE